MAHTLPLRAPLDDNGLPRTTPPPADVPLPVPALVTETGTGLGGRGYEITPAGMDEIFARLRPHLPTYLKAVHHHRYSIQYEFATFTGREKEPSTPDVYTDPKLACGSDDEAERALRKAARRILVDLYRQASQRWQDAAYVADLKETVGDASTRWQAYEREIKALESAYAYLRTPEAAAEWPSALSRMVDAQDRAMAAASAFDDRAWEIARVHETHLYADLGHDAALERAGYPEAKDWDIASADTYASSWGPGVPLTEQVRRLITDQDTHVAKVGRLSGTTTG
ncbi:hypothetical protein J8N05_47055 (plasmid) [Streptomyces sp. BH-SS-21]|uniref:Uncharacterized protein n=1 Tax=Streptomyces liliiviolaceus TaxID=2823109 RepID=A0A940Y4Z9_9ACTN|nr:hypothetical protein [Streptomyces liliiviolaceus]MBQ0855721.1 hypothetical protein [Streptomyces liliiviolaceus]